METNIAKIEDKLFLGSMFSISNDNIQKYGINFIFHIGFEIPKGIDTCQHEYFELEDRGSETSKMLEISDYIVKKINTLISSSYTVLVCCVAGRSRSASMIALYLHSKYPNLSYEEIINKKIKPFRSISINKNFEDAIRSKILNDYKSLKPNI